jgi:hypothetical protein
VDKSGTVVSSWLDLFGSTFIMSDITLDWIWSEYTTSPDRAAGMQCLQQMCSALYKHVLLPTHIVLSGGGFSLHPDLAQLLTNVVPPLGCLLDLVLRSAGLPGEMLARCLQQQY